MASEKTEYLKKLEMLKQAYMTCYGVGAGDRIVNRLSLLIALHEGSEMFAQIAENLKSSFLIDIDRDVNYMEWSKMETWAKWKSEVARGDLSALNYETLEMNKDSVYVNRLTDLLPQTPSPDTAAKDSKTVNQGLTYSEREKFRQTINNLINPNVFNDTVLDYAIYAALNKLCNSLISVNRAIPLKPDKSKCEALYKRLCIRYSSQFGKDIEAKHEAWQDRYLDDNISVDSFKEHINKEIANFLMSGTLDDIEANTSKTLKAEYERDFDFNEFNWPGINKVEIYSHFRAIYTYKDGLYSVDMAKAGLLAFKLRKDIDKLETFFHFNSTLNYYNRKIEEQQAASRVNSICGDNDISEQPCRFSDEEVRASGIKKHAKDVLAVMDHMQNGKPNAYWLGFYCVLLEKDLIEDNISGFCANMNSLFGIKLDRSTLNGDKNKYGTDIVNWPEWDSRLREKKNFALKFRENLGFRLDNKLQNAIG